MKILITGVSQGLGWFLANELLKQGHEVWGVSRKGQEHQPIKELHQYTNFIYSSCDLTQENRIANLVDDVIQRKFAIETLILNAALMESDYINGRWDFLKYREIMEVNLIGAANLTAKLLPFFQERKKGIIVGVSSLASIRALLRNKIAYAASKVALNMTFEALRLQMGYSYPNIRFITVILGPLEQKGQLFSRSYSQVGQKIISIIKKSKYKEVYTYPLMSLIVYKIFCMIPDRLAAKYVIQVRRE